MSSQALSLGVPLALAIASVAVSCSSSETGANAPVAPAIDASPLSDGALGPPTLADRAAAATATAESAANPCAGIRPFYWEIGDTAARLAGASVDADADAGTYAADSSMNIASASKWLYSAYVAQKRNGALTDEDLAFLTFRSGYTSFTICLPGQTVDGCVAFLNNGVHSDATDGVFYYGGGHMQKHASLDGLGPLDNATLAAEIATQIGADVGLSYTQPQLAGGGVATADGYARFLRKLLAGDLVIGGMLGSHAVCASPTTCPTEAASTPIPASETWHYSIGHWVEDDPVVGDGAVSSPGAFGFYPWIDASRTYYGIVARKVAQGYYESVQCGRLIRKAWIDGRAMP